MATVSIHAAGGSITPSKASGWTVRLVTLAVWAALAGSVTYWVLQWPQAGAAREGLVTTLAGADEQIAPPAAASLNRALGAAAVGADRVSAPGWSSRLSLVGVVRAGARDGAALIAVDGKAARAVRLGGEVEPGLYLLALEPRRASLGADPRGAETLALELPKPKAP
ncbi:MAG: general secretion pathway protein C [Betaproteobacteria bacterium]|nr:general secretion pathway protein C [Betaproteobacteria bacterium]